MELVYWNCPHCNRTLRTTITDPIPTTCPRCGGECESLNNWKSRKEVARRVLRGDRNFKGRTPVVRILSIGLKGYKGTHSLVDLGDGYGVLFTHWNCRTYYHGEYTPHTMKELGYVA